MRVRSLILSVSIFLSPIVVSQAQDSASQPQTSARTADKAEPEPFTSDTPDILRETQLGVRHPGYTGLVWWIPYEFWVQSAQERGVSAEKTEQAFGKLRDYTVVCVFAAQVSGLGVLDFFSADDIEKNIVLRDASGKEYVFIKEPSQDAKNLAAIIKPVLAGAIGKAGENMQILFFPGRTKEGAVIADATHKGQFSFAIKNILGAQETVYLWRLPLTSLAAPKYCPRGKERVNLNWEYCPWHGVPLN
ncbi:MAG TPA: hypothetical protein VE377_26685 [Candidatus Dormibacteraeota bacterium]|nr:hypothetical protein [Candidatus Dormibacteraeota bacterium]